MIENMIEGDCPPIMEGKNLGGVQEVNAVMNELERLDELDRQTRCDEVSDGAVDTCAVRTDANGLLNEGVREPRLKMESRKQVVSESTDRCANDQSAQISTHDRLAQALVVVAWDDHFHEGGERELCRLQKFESGPEVKVLKRSVIGAIVDV